MMASESPVRAWRAADTPVGAHALAAAGCGPERYAYVRGVAQQAARLARVSGLTRDVRAQVLCAAWLSWIGPGATSEALTLDGPRALRRAGHEHLARVLAWAGAAPQLRLRRSAGPVGPEFPAPAGGAARVLILLDVALVTTDLTGAASVPAVVLRDLVGRHGHADPAVAAFVGLVADLAGHPEARTLIEAVAPQHATVGR
jgi:hypothetical protein